MYIRIIYTFFFRCFSLIGYYKILSVVPCAIQYVLVVYVLYMVIYVSSADPKLIYPPPFSSGNPKCVFYVSDSISVL